MTKNKHMIMFPRNHGKTQHYGIAVEAKEFDRMQAIGRKLREIFDRDGTPFNPGCEDYLVRSVEEAKRLLREEEAQ